MTHIDKTGQEFARLAGKVTSLEVHGSTAFVTGEIDRGHAPDVVGDPVGQTLPITILDHGSSDLADPPQRASHGHRPDQTGISYIPSVTDVKVRS